MAIRERDGKYFIDYYANGHRVREAISGSRALAEKVLRKRQSAIDENRYLDIKRSEKIRFEDFLEDYLEHHSKLNNRSWKRAEIPNMKRLKAYFSGRLLQEITPLDVEKFKAKTLTEVSPATTNRCLALLKSMFNKATIWGKLNGPNPVKGIKLFREESRLRFLEKEEIATLLKYCNGYLYPVVTVALHTGMRKSEILNLKWHDVDFSRDNIYLSQTKNGEKREVSMNSLVRSTLIKVRKHPSSPYIFVNAKGKPYTDIRKSFHAALHKAGIRDFRFHDLRHTFASQLAMAGVDLNSIRELMGHKSIKMTLRYSHLSSGHKKRAVEALNNQIGTIWAQEPVNKTEETATPSQLLTNSGVMVI
ncbi:MAG: site-specific integrase [Candidatus Omnitrophica bacterium]|nr:site-specific integrase [Candidatus Omnitrophota bacterium]